MIVSILLPFVIAYLFYDSWLGLIPGAAAGFCYFLEWRKEKQRRDSRKYLLEFKAMMSAVDAALEGGYSLENSFILAERDIAELYGKKSRLLAKLRVMNRRLSLHEPVDKVLTEFAEEGDTEEIRAFADVISIIRKTGGNTIRIVRESVRTISERIDVENDISAIIAGKKLEQKIMVLMPFIIIFYTRLTMSRFMSVLYDDMSGRIFMTIMLCLVLIADRVGKHITDIEV
ncbi:MAG: hypothetical protein IJJ74_00340 [Eubacterium sp.]|nr:hypothetical protein [Eubacterium sp.]